MIRLFVVLLVFSVLSFGIAYGYAKANKKERRCLINTAALCALFSSIGLLIMSAIVFLF